MELFLRFHCLQQPSYFAGNAPAHYHSLQLIGLNPLVLSHLCLIYTEGETAWHDSARLGNTQLLATLKWV